MMISYQELVRTFLNYYVTRIMCIFTHKWVDQINL